MNDSGPGANSTIVAATPRGVPLSVGGYAISDSVIEFKLSSASTRTTIADGIGTGTTYRHTGLTNGLTYNYWDFAVNPVGQGSQRSGRPVDRRGW